MLGAHGMGGTGTIGVSTAWEEVLHKSGRPAGVGTWKEDMLLVVITLSEQGMYIYLVEERSRGSTKPNLERDTHRHTLGM